MELSLTHGEEKVKLRNTQQLKVSSSGGISFVVLYGKKKKSFSKTLFDLISLYGLWQVFHGVNGWHGSLKEYRKKMLEKEKMSMEHFLSI